MRRCLAAGLAEDQPGVEQQCADGHTVQQARQGVKPALAQLGAVLPDGGQGRGSVVAQGQVVEADDAQVLGDAQPQLQAVKHDGVGQQVVAAQDGSHILAQQGREVFLETLGKIVVAPSQMMVIWQPVFAQCMEKGEVALLVHIGAETATQVADLPMAQLFQISHSQVHSFVVVHTYIAAGGVGRDVVVQQDRRGPAGLQLVQPGVRQGQPQEEGPDKVVLEHVLVVAGGFLDGLAEIHDLHHKAGGFRRPPEPGDDVVAKIGRLGIGHVLDEKAELLGSLFVEGAGVAQIDGSFQNSFSQCFAHVGGAVQSLGNCALGDIQLVCNVLDSGHKSPWFGWQKKDVRLIALIIASSTEKINSHPFAHTRHSLFRKVLKPPCAKRQKQALKIVHMAEIEKIR